MSELHVLHFVQPKGKQEGSNRPHHWVKSAHRSQIPLSILFCSLALFVEILDRLSVSIGVHAHLLSHRTTSTKKPPRVCNVCMYVFMHVLMAQQEQKNKTMKIYIDTLSDTLAPYTTQYPAHYSLSLQDNKFRWQPYYSESHTSSSHAHIEMKQLMWWIHTRHILSLCLWPLLVFALVFYFSLSQCCR